MRIEGDTLFIEEEISDEAVNEFYVTANQKEIKRIKIINPNLSASIIQVLLLLKKEKNIETDDYTLNKIFENVIYKKNV